MRRIIAQLTEYNENIITLIAYGLSMINRIDRGKISRASRSRDDPADARAEAAERRGGRTGRGPRVTGSFGRPIYRTMRVHFSPRRREKRRRITRVRVRATRWRARARARARVRPGMALRSYSKLGPRASRGRRLVNPISARALKCFSPLEVPVPIIVARDVEGSLAAVFSL